MNLIDYLPTLLVDEELDSKLAHLPESDTQNNISKNERLIRVLDIYNIFIPSQLTRDTYNTLYYQLLRSFQRKEQLIQSGQLIDNRHRIEGRYKPKGINGCDSSLLCGSSGLGKTTSIQRIIEVLTNNKNIIIENPYCEIIPILLVEASPISSIKGFLFDILRAIDSNLGTNYYEANNRSTINSDSLIGVVSNALLLHVGVLIVDECDRFLANRKSNTMINYIVELLNCSGISVMFVGTNNVVNFFQMTPYLARRSMGTIYTPMEYGEEFISFLKNLFKYQYTNNRIELNGELCRCFYDLTNGVQALVVQLFAESQRFAIMNDYEIIAPSIVNKAFNSKMFIMSPYLNQKEKAQTTHYEPKIQRILKEDFKNNSLLNLFSEEGPKGKNDPQKAICEWKKFIKVIEIKL